ncbi:kelch-like protein 5 [Sycon ciliatum]|uniref:kelch-like protein 5 n=1 Tax=Sycon ciliatum TaxID=27933 RepID=UPI0020AE2EE6|eukprot:scpid24791/ scgid18853/ Kelch-like protein 5
MDGHDAASNGEAAQSHIELFSSDGPVATAGTFTNFTPASSAPNELFVTTKCEQLSDGNMERPSVAAPTCSPSSETEGGTSPLLAKRPACPRFPSTMDEEALHCGESKRAERKPLALQPSSLSRCDARKGALSSPLGAFRALPQELPDKQGFPTHTRTLADNSASKTSTHPYGRTLCAGSCGVSSDYSFSATLAVGDGGTGYNSTAASRMCELSRVKASPAISSSAPAAASSALQATPTSMGHDLTVAAAAEANDLCLSTSAGNIPGVKSENALLVAAGVVSDDEADSQVRFVVPRLSAAAAGGAATAQDTAASPDILSDDSDSIVLEDSDDAHSGEAAVAGDADEVEGPEKSQCDGPSPVRRHSRATLAAGSASGMASSTSSLGAGAVHGVLSPQGSLRSATRHSLPRGSKLQRPLSQAESLNVYPYMEPRHATNLLTKIERLWTDNSLCDVILVVDGRRIPAHRIVLCSTSEYFYAMFAGAISGKETRMPEVVIHDVDGAAMAQLVAYSYTCKLDIHSQNVQSLLKAASMLQMHDVMMACQNYMCEQLHSSNCLGIRAFSQQFGCEALYESAETFVEEYFLDVIKHEEFLQMSTDDVVELLSRDDVNVENECQVYEAALRWIQHQQSGTDRRQHTARLLGCVRLPFLPPEYIADHVETEEIIQSSPECQPLLLEALKYHLLPERCILSNNPRTHPRRSTVGSLFAVGGMDLSRGAMTIEEYNYRLNQWRTVGEMRSRRLQCGVAVIDRFIYTVGGRDGLKTLNSVEKFDTRHHSWSTVASMCTHRHGVGVAVLSGPMYAVGGHDGWSYLNTVERYDPDLNGWSFLQPMQAARSTAGVAVLAGKLYAVGGRDSISCLASVECYDPHLNRWIGCPAMSQKRGGVGVAVCNGKLFAVGGHEAATPFDLVECFDPAVGQWTKVSPMMSCRDAVGVTSFANKLFAVGGYNGYMYLNSVECLNIANKKWENTSVLCTGRAGAGVVAVKDVRDRSTDEDCEKMILPV